MRVTKGTIKSDEGFYVGDICYVLNHNALYTKVWGDNYGYEDGKIRDPKTGLCFMVSGTAYGDGTYYDEHGNEYPVDAGVIGLVPLELCESFDPDDGYFDRTPGEASFEAIDGAFTIELPSGREIHISTYDEFDAEEDE